MVRLSKQICFVRAVAIWSPLRTMKRQMTFPAKKEPEADAYFKSIKLIETFLSPLSALFSLSSPLLCMDIRA